MEQKFTSSSCWEYLFLSRRWAIWRCFTGYPKWTVYDLYMTPGTVSPITQTSQESFCLFTGNAQTKALSWKLLKQVFWKNCLLLLDPVAFSKEWQYLQIKYLFKYLYVFSLQNLCLLGLSARTLNPSYKICPTSPTLQLKKLLRMNEHLFFCLDLLKSFRFSSCYSYLQLWLLDWIVAMQTAWSYMRNYSCCIVLLSCPGKKSKQNDIILSPLYFWVRFSVSIVICRTWSVWLSWNCVLSWPMRPNEVPELAVYRFTFLEHTEHCEIKVSHCSDATSGWQGNNVSLVLWK